MPGRILGLRGRAVLALCCSLLVGEMDNKQIHNPVSISTLKKNKYKRIENGREREGVSSPMLSDGKFQRCYKFALRSQWQDHLCLFR